MTRLAFLYLRVGAMNEFQYRANFAVQIVQSLLSLGTGLVVLALVFSHTTDLRGWTQPELLVVLGVFTVMGGIIRTFIQPNMAKVLGEIRLGTFDYVLTKPADAQLLASVREVQIWQLVDVISGGVVLGVGLGRIDQGAGIGDAFAFAGLLMLGVVMIYCFWLMLTTGAFWFVRMDQMQELFDGIYRAGQYPVAIYPAWLKIGLTFLVPLAFAITVPSEAVTNRLTARTVGLSVVVAFGLVVVSRWLWRAGLRRYSGASA